MMKMERTPPPDFLRKHCRVWGREFAERREENPKYRFQWKSCEGRKVNEKLGEEFGSHCAFCDGYPLGGFSHKTIEHFRPKSQYPRLAYTWPNLFPCCNVCQNAKGEKFDRKLLKPDTKDYRFDRYFVLNYKTGKIEVSPSAGRTEQERAEITIEMYGLNRFGRPRSRLVEWKKYQGVSEEDLCIDDFSYRFFL
ncbi:MAG: TIGR02646 family protein [Deltaproteobacteria bacterium]|nr:MAG: TIGR02646 family protein [Deltaproteobacteria bacterium]